MLQYLHQFSTYKELIYTKFLQMLWRFHRTNPFIDSYPTSRVRRSNASPLFFGTPLIWGLFCAVLAMRPCFQRPFSNISCIFNLSKHVPIAKKWQKRRERVLTNCNHAKSNGNVVSTKAFASLHEMQFLGKCKLFFGTCGPPKNTYT